MSVLAEVRKKLTWDDIKGLPEEGKTELVEGELYVSPTAGAPHQRIGTRLAVLIQPFVEERDLGEFFGRDLHVVLDEHNHFEPDLCFIRKERLHLIVGPYLDGPPDLAIEILSESDRQRDTQLKFAYYERYGVAEYWIVDPRERRIAVFALEDGRYASLGEFGPGSLVRTRALEGLELDPARVFAERPTG